MDFHKARATRAKGWHTWRIGLLALLSVDVFWSEASAKPINLRTQVVVQEKTEPAEPYNRRQHFGAWVRATGCLNVRNAVLLRDAKDHSVEFFPDNNCRVKSGVWFDPFSNDFIFNASEIEIDHIIPLKNAYESGAAEWTKERRCHFSNFLWDGSHLLPVFWIENRKKGDSDPSEYVPPSPVFRCKYLHLWMRIKATWDLALTPEEMQSIEQLSVENQCDPATFEIEDDQLFQLKQATFMVPEQC